MTVRTLTAAGCALAGIAMANVAIAQGGWPTIGINDLEPCRAQIAQFHQMEFAYYREQMDRYCPTTSQYHYAPNCTNYQNMLNESTRKNDLAWYVEGNGSCEGGDYPCFGVTLPNDPRSGEDEKRWIEIFETNIASMGTTIKPGSDFYEAGHAVDNCTTAIWLKKYKAWRNGAPSPSPAASPQPQQVAARLVSASDPAFNSRLQTSQPDQLVQLAQELLATGQIDLAKLARNALLARYPDSPLVPAMVDLLLAASTSSPAPAPAAPPALITPAANTPSAYAAPAAPPRLFVNDAASLTSAFAQAGYTLVPTSTPNQLVDAQNRFYAYFLDCNGTRCGAVQLIAKFSLSPMPTHDRIVQWNRDKLYGRAYLNGTMVDFDMALKIPSAGIETPALQEQIALFIDASNAFYRHLIGG
jgi:hypothetical protein